MRYYDTKQMSLEGLERFRRADVVDLWLGRACFILALACAIVWIVKLA